jgi:hypothetical protein
MSQSATISGQVLVAFVIEPDGRACVPELFDASGV